MTAEQLRDIRREMRMTQKDFAVFLGVCKRTVEYWESGTRRIPIPIVKLLAFYQKTKEVTA